LFSTLWPFNPWLRTEHSSPHSIGDVAETGLLEGNGWTVVSGMTGDNAIETLSLTSAAA